MGSSAYLQDQIDVIFRGFSESATAMSHAFMPVVLLFMAAGFAWAIYNSPTAETAFRAFINLVLVLLVLIGFKPALFAVQAAIGGTINNELHASPDQVAERYENEWNRVNANVDVQLENESRFSVSKFIHALTFFVFRMIGALASALILMFLLLQRFFMHALTALAPIFIGFLAFPPMREAGWTFLKNALALTTWQIGFALVSLGAEGLLTSMVDSSVGTTGVLGNLVVGVSDLVHLFLIAVWYIVALPGATFFIHRMVLSGFASIALNLRRR